MIKESEKITISCYGCGHTITLRKRKVSFAQYYICGRRGFNCKEKIPHPKLSDNLINNMVLVEEMNAAGYFYGYRYEWADKETRKSIGRAKELLNAGIDLLNNKKPII